MSAATVENKHALVLAEPAAIGKELALVDPRALAVPDAPDPALDAQAVSFVQSVLSFDPEDPSKQDQRYGKRGCGGSLGQQDPARGLASLGHAQGAHSKARGQGRRRRASGGRAGEPQAASGGAGSGKVRFRGRVAVPDPGVHSGHRDPR